jgi:putative inorganic carbon (HCO3(-)) transporter
MFLFFLIAIFFRPFISSAAFPYLNLIYTCLLLVFLGMYVIYKRLSFARLPTLVCPIILFVLALLISLIFSQNRSDSLSELYKYISGLLLFLVAASLSEKEKSVTIRVIVEAGLIISFLAIYQYFFGFRHVLNYLSDNKLSPPFALDYLTRKRVFLPFVTPGILGGYLAMTIPLLLINKNRFWLMLPVLLALFFTKSLGAFLSLFCALIIYVCVRKKIKMSHLLGLLGLFLLIIIILIWRSGTQKEYIQPIFSTMMRLNYWKGTLEIIKAHPLVGVGLGNFNLKLSRYAHNSYLQIWAEMGILGLVSFVWIICVVIRSYFKNSAELLYKNQATCLFVASSVFLIHNFLDFTFFLPEVVFVWWVILGLIMVGDQKNSH